MPQSHEHSAFVRGSISGVIVVALLQPFDVIKTVQQASGCGARDAMNVIIRENGVKGLWLRGLAPTLVRGALGPGIYFQALEMTQGLFANKQNKLVDFTQGALARAIGAVVISPFSVLKARIEWDPKSKMRFTGFRDMFVGLSHTLARDVPFSGLYIVFYRLFKSGLEDLHDSHLRRFTMDFSAGLAAGFFATAATHPFDVFKTRSQVGMPISFTQNVFSGLMLRLAKRPLSMALTWAFYEIVSRKSEIEGESKPSSSSSMSSSSQS